MEFTMKRMARLGLAAAALGFIAAAQVAPTGSVAVAQANGLVDTDPMDDAFVQLNDVVHPDKDTFTIRGRVSCETGENPVADGDANGVTVTALQSSAPTPPFPLYTPVKSKTFTGEQCRAIFNGRSLYCKDPADGSFFRLRRSSSPTRFRVNTVVRRQEFEIGKPYQVPLAGDVLFSQFHWFGETELPLCRVTHNGERTTCRTKN
jgi:hypothetical protein